MLDLKAKLALAGLVTDEDIERVERGDARKGKSGKGPKSAKGKGNRGGAQAKPLAHRLDVAKLKSVGRGEMYAEVRRWIERVRLDAPGKTPGEDAKTFHFPTAKGQIGRLVVETEVHEWLAAGSAGVVAYMGNHGLAHAIVPADAARTVAELSPLWLRVLAGDARAGALEEVQPAPDAETEADSESAHSPESEPAP